MKTWIVTGGAASGKSTFCRILKELDSEIAFFSSDEAVHRLYKTESVVSQLVKELGSTVRNLDGSVNRPVLRELVLKDEERRLKLESILHPLVLRARDKWRREIELEGKTQLLIAEVPLFYESKSEFQADLVILVAISPALQQQRIVQTRSLSSETADRLLSAQLPLTRKLELADKVVWNEGDLTLLKLQAQQLIQPIVASTDAK